jgi:dTDP-glucose 4,6-dehydratase/UDP-glucose 4-epimerase
MSRHLVTGGAGFIGSALAHRLVAEGHDVIVLDRFSRGSVDRLPGGVHAIAGDIRDTQIVRKACLNVDVIWHLAYVQGTQTFYADPKDVIDVALKGIVNVLSACENAPRKPDLVLVSTSEVYQNPPAGMFPTDETVPLSVPDVTNPRYSYGGGKIASEIATLAYAQAGLINRAVIVRPHNIYGPDMGREHVIPEFALRMLALPAHERAFRIQGTGQETRSFCYIDDCVDGLMTAWERGENKNVYHLGNPAEEHTIRDLAHAVAAYFGREIDVMPGTLPKGSPTRRLPSIDKLAGLGFEPKVSLAEGLPSALAWYEAQAGEKAAA